MAASEQQPRRGRLIDRVRSRKHDHKQRGRLYRVAFATAGFLVVAAGIALSLPGIPGPGLLVVAIGLAMLALEFAWAEHLLERVLDQLESVGRTAREASRTQRVAAAVGAALAVGGAVAIALLWDVPFLPV